MGKLIFSLVLLLTTEIIYLITGRNRRQIARIPKGMAILCQPPGKRYVAYAVGVVQLLFVAFFKSYTCNILYHYISKISSQYLFLKLTTT